MARIRTVKPEFFTSEQVMDCSTTARLLFIGMWCFCDDQGVHPASARTLKAEVFPGDDMPVEAVQAMVDELLSVGLLVGYESGGKPYWYVTGWSHQRIEKPNRKHPSPPGTEPELDDQSTTSRRPFDDHSTPEGKGKEGKGKEKSVNPAPKSARFDPTSLALPDGLPADKWAEWLAYRRQRRWSMAEPTARKQLEFLTECLARGQPPGDVIDASIRNGWQGLFPLKDSKNGSSRADRLDAVAAELTGRGAHHPRTIDGSARQVD